VLKDTTAEDGQLHRDWPHHVGLPAEKLRGMSNSETVRGTTEAVQSNRTVYLL
jgi:hypothetical protein